MRLAGKIHLVLGFAALQLSLMSGAVACPMTAAMQMQTASATMTDMPTTPVTVDREAGSVNRGAPSPTGTPCPQSGSPRACQLMTACQQLAVAPPTPPRAPSTPAATTPSRKVLTPALLAYTPETPPPRA